MYGMGPWNLDTKIFHLGVRFDTSSLRPNSASRSDTSARQQPTSTRACERERGEVGEERPSSLFFLKETQHQARQGAAREQQAPRRPDATKDKNKCRPSSQVPIHGQPLHTRTLRGQAVRPRVRALVYRLDLVRHFRAILEQHRLAACAAENGGYRRAESVRDGQIGNRRRQTRSCAARLKRQTENERCLLSNTR